MSLTSVFGKIMDCVVARDMNAYLFTNKLLITWVFIRSIGFIQAININKSLRISKFNDRTISIKNKYQNRAAYIDFSRAFHLSSAMSFTCLSVTLSNIISLNLSSRFCIIDVIHHVLIES